MVDYGLEDGARQRVLIAHCAAARRDADPEAWPCRASAGIRLTDAAMQAINITHHDFHCAGNYTMVLNE